MLNDLVKIGESVMSNVMSILRFHINDYSDLETTSGDAFVAKDGSMGTLLRYNGFRSLVGSAEYKQFSKDLANGLEQFFGHRGHQIQAVYLRDDDPEHKINQLLEPSYQTCEILGLNLEDLLDEKRDITKKYCLDEETYLVLWTRPAVLDPLEFKMSAQESQEMRRRYNLPPMADAQNFTRPNRFIADLHDAFVSKFVDDVKRLQGSVDIVRIHDAIREMKQCIYKNTPKSWRPVLVGDPLIGRWKSKGGNDISAAMYYRLQDQIFSTNGEIGKKRKTGYGGLTDTRAVRIGDCIFAPVSIKIPPQRKESFTRLFAQLNNAATVNANGERRPMPWSISFMIEGDGLKGVSLRKIFASILGLTSSDNRNLVKAVEALSVYKENEKGAVVKMQISAVTWADYDQEKELMKRRKKLSSALQGWGGCVVDEETGDPLETLVSCVPGLSTKAYSVASAPPLDWVTYMLPLSRPASPFFRGTSAFRTLDHKIMPWEIFSDEQSTWLTAIFGGPGSGKSVLANRLNVEMCMLAGLKRLPFICVVDIGISSEGFILTIKDSLPESKKHLAMYARLQNTERYCMNQFDTSLGQRFLLPREREIVKNFLVRLATPPERGRAHHFMDIFVGRVIDDTYKRRADIERGAPREYVPNVNDVVRQAVEKHNIPYREGTKWWTIVDELAKRGLYYEASVAQRYAVPVLFDLLSTASDPNLAKEFSNALDEDMPVVDEFKLMVNAAMEDFKIFSGVTAFDFGESRVMSIDLQDVALKGSKAAEKQTSLMYMAAINAFMRKVSIIEEDLPSISPPYRAYHARRVQELQADYKRLFCDEYHKTGGDANLRETFMIYGRESRKWQLEVVLSSQLPRDFAEIAEIATTVIIMDSGNETTRGSIESIFGLSATECQALRTYVNGAIPGVGATFLAKIKTKTSEMSQLFTSTSGGLELWALSTTAEDRALRSSLYKRMPPVEARAILKEAFPTGSCKKYVLDKKGEIQKENDGFIDDDKLNTILEELAEKLTARWRKRQADTTDFALV